MNSAADRDFSDVCKKDRRMAATKLNTWQRGMSAKSAPRSLTAIKKDHSVATQTHGYAIASMDWAMFLKSFELRSIEGKVKQSPV